MIIYKANDKGFVTEVCIVNEKIFTYIESAKPYHEIRDYRDVEVNYNGHYFTIWIPFDNHFHKLNSEIVTVEDMKLFKYCYSFDGRILIC